MLKPGKYLANVIDADLWKNKAGNPVAVVMFGYFDEEGNSQTISWLGQTTGGALAITVETLVRLGFQGVNLADLVNGKEALDFETQFELVLENHTYENKTSVRVKYINLPGGSGFREKMSKEEAVQLTAGLNLGAHFMEARQKVGKVPTKAAMPTTGVGSQIKTDEIVPW